MSLYIVCDFPPVLLKGPTLRYSGLKLHGQSIKISILNIMLINDVYNLHNNHNNVKSVGNRVMSKFEVSILQTYGFGQELSSIRFPIRILVAFFGKLYSNKICF